MGDASPKGTKAESSSWLPKKKGKDAAYSKLKRVLAKEG